MRQLSFALAAGFVAEVPPVGPYRSFPADLAGRVRWAREAPVRGAAAKIVLTTLAGCANDAGKAWPSLSTLGRWTGCSQATLCRALDTLEDRGWLQREARDGHSTLYWPKSPAERICELERCRVRLPAECLICPVCGTEGVSQYETRVSQYETRVSQYETHKNQGKTKEGFFMRRKHDSLV